MAAPKTTRTRPRQRQATAARLEPIGLESFQAPAGVPRANPSAPLQSPFDGVRQGECPMPLEPVFVLWNRSRSMKIRNPPKAPDPTAPWRWEPRARPKPGERPTGRPAAAQPARLAWKNLRRGGRHFGLAKASGEVPPFARATQRSTDRFAWRVRADVAPVRSGHHRAFRSAILQFGGDLEAS